MKNLEKLTNIIESILFVSGTQVSVKDIADKLEVSDADVKKAVKILSEKYGKDCGIHLLCFNNKLQFCSNPEYAEEVSSVLNPIKERELSKSMLEAAAIIAYKQPVTRIDLEEIRGVNSEYVIQKLLELGIIEPVGRKDAVGRPVLFGTTDNFLKRFQISSLDELPDYDELVNKISLLNGNTQGSDYLYKKDVYVEEVAVTESDFDDESKSNVDNEDPPKKEKVIDEVVSGDNFDLPDITEEEIPDFLKGEKVNKIS